MSSLSDEEALDNLLDSPQLEHSALTGWLRKTLLSSTLLLTVALGFWGGSAHTFSSQRQTLLLSDAHFEQKASVGEAAVEPSVGEAAVEPSLAMQRNEQRQRLIVEGDLKTLLHMVVSNGEAHYRQQVSSQEGAAVCLQQADRLFGEVVPISGLDKELDAQELSTFKHRFGSAMKMRCKDLISERLWRQAAGMEFEQQKPVMTAAVAASINSAGMGFKTKMHDWLLHESVESFQHHLGLLPTPKGQKSVLKRKASGRQADSLPAAFRADLKWPMCKEEILRIHNQGHCGSCWAFGGTASIDARMCIASNGKWHSSKDVLSRLHVASCAPGDGHDGCQGGWPHWPMEMMARTGIVSSECLPYYIGGEGDEHFDPGPSQSSPPCESHCQGGYSLPLRNDTFSSAGVANYDWIVNMHGDPSKVSIMKTAILQEGPIAFAFKVTHPFIGYSSGIFSGCTGHDYANHAVYTFGWGVAPQADGGDAVEYFEASNSWGRHWGAGGYFRIHPRCITDVTIPGTIESNVVAHDIGSVDSTVPLDPKNEYWPWLKPDECPYNNGCITDLGGSGNYTNNELCVSKALNGKTIRVVEFDTEGDYDVLSVNGKEFSGADGAGLDLVHLNGLVVDDLGIKFQSDTSVRMAGFKLCGDR